MRKIYKTPGLSRWRISADIFFFPCRGRVKTNLSGCLSARRGASAGCRFAPTSSASRARCGTPIVRSCRPTACVGDTWRAASPWASSKSIASVMCFMLSPRLMQRRKSFLKRLESETEYAIAISPFPYKSPLASHNDTLYHASHRPSPRDSQRSW